jgi:hypothetical protein
VSPHAFDEPDRRFSLQDTGSREESATHATPRSAAVTTAIDLAFADADARILERRRLTRAAFANAFDN